MKEKNIILYFVFPVIFLFASGCSGNPADSDTLYQLTSFRHIPNLTEEEINAIETLHDNYEYFIYAMPLNAEAFLNINGEIKGFTALFCKWLTEFFGIPFRPEIYEWESLLNGLANYDISFTGELTATEERHSIYHMTSTIASRPLKYFTLSGSSPLSEIALQRPLRCGFIDGTATILTVSSMMENETFEVITLSNVNLVYDALKNGEIDAFYYSGVIEANFIGYEDMVSSYFYPILFMPVSFTTQNPALEPVISIMEKAMKYEITRRYLAKLYNDGYQEYLKHKLTMQLTEEEQRFIQNNQTVRFAAETDNYPLCFYNKREGKWQGIVIDVLREAEGLTGLNFERVNDENTNMPELLKLLENGEAIMISGLMNLGYQQTESFLMSDTSLLTVQSALISTLSHPNITINDILHMRVGLIEGYANMDYFLLWFPDHPGAIPFKHPFDAFEALDRGELDAIMAGNFRLFSLTHYMERPDYKIIYEFDNSYYAYLGFSRDEAILRSIMDKALILIDVDGISRQWLQKTFDYKIKIAEAQLPWLLGAIALSLLVLTLVLYMYFKSRNSGLRLEGLVAERTSEITKAQKDLLVAEYNKKIAEHSSSAKSEFLSRMSHEMLTPMNAIMGFAELAKTSCDGDQIMLWIDKIYDSANHLLAMLRNVLDVSDGSSAFTIVEAQFLFRSMIKNILNKTNPDLKRKGQKLILSIPQTIPETLIGDEKRIAQVTIHLLANAIKFSPEQSKIYLGLNILEEENEIITLKIEVTDNGIGISKEQQESLFNLFEQADRGNKRKYGGIGIGLPLSKCIVKMMDGDIWFESEPGKGSKFMFTCKVKTLEN